MSLNVSDYSGGSIKADHLCVLVHGLWGNPNHLTNIAKALRAQHSEDKLYILGAKRNSGWFTYDGIELGGERVCLEIEEELQAIERRGGKITKLSIVGYSLGGLVARYAIGLLYAKGILDNLECMNFTAFASPFLGVRAPIKGWRSHAWNVLGARMLSSSGRQLFGIDKFRDTDRPLVAVLADPKSIFMSGLAKFKRRTLYANIQNDRSAVYYTTGIAKTDPYTDMSKVKVNYVKGYDDVILDPVNPISSGVPAPPKKESLRERAKKWIRRLPFLSALMVFVPVGIVAFFINSAIQTVRSSRRMKLHERGLAGIRIEDYRVPLWVKELRGAVDDAYENLSGAQKQEYLSLSEDEAEWLASDDDEAGGRDVLAVERKEAQAAQPTLALSSFQFTAIQALDNLGWNKYPVWIKKDGHSHAAIVVRMDKETFTEGWVVMKHWLNEEFMT
ncbi:DUF676-domain-containing protein [Thozetella sp. PMI_491]|nr:DUF676-domain-containing protein [Thozetella sp. PMI_491]